MVNRKNIQIQISSILLILFFSPIIIQGEPGHVQYVSGSTVKISQLVGEYDRHLLSPTRNLTESRCGLISTDLGVPFQHNGRTFVIFGDTWGEPGGDAIAFTTDTDPNDGIELEFITDETGTYKPVSIQGISQNDFEVPMEGVSVDGKMYVYHTTGHSETVVMERSVLAVSNDEGHTFQYLYDLSRKHFINVSIVDVNLSDWPGFPDDTGTGLVMFGSGDYRKSDVRLAFQPADYIESPASLRYFIGMDENGTPMWSEQEVDAVPLFSHPCVGELSVSFNPFINKWLMLYNGDPPRGIIFRTADEPWGPWSEPQLLFDPWLDNGYCHFMHVNWQFRQCDSIHDLGRENEWGGEYGPYQFENLATGTDSTTTIYYTLSTWNPYTIVLMKSTLKLITVSDTKVENLKPPVEFYVEPCYPNPFNPQTRFGYQLFNPGFVEISVHDLLGRKINTIVNASKDVGYYEALWNGNDENGINVSTGMYLIRFQTRETTRIQKVLYVK